MSRQIPSLNTHLETIRPLHEYSSTVLSHAYSCHRRDLRHLEAESLVTQQAIEGATTHLKDMNKRIALLSECEGESQTDGEHISELDILVNTRHEQMELLNRLQATALRLKHSTQVANSHMTEISALLRKRRNETKAAEGQLLSRLDINGTEGEE